VWEPLQLFFDLKEEFGTPVLALAAWVPPPAAEMGKKVEQAGGTLIRIPPDRKTLLTTVELLLSASRRP
jgi:hypothetical protein